MKLRNQEDDIKDNIWHLHTLSTDRLLLMKVKVRVSERYTFVRPNQDQVKNCNSKVSGIRIYQNKSVMYQSLRRMPIRKCSRQNKMNEELIALTLPFLIIII